MLFLYAIYTQVSDCGNQDLYVLYVIVHRRTELTTTFKQWVGVYTALTKKKQFGTYIYM